MSQAGFEAFRQRVLEDPTLQAKLREESDLERFQTLVVALGTEHGFDFSVDEVKEAVRASRRAWLERWV